MPASTTLDHITIVTNDFEASRSVYEPLLGAIGLLPSVDYEDPEAEPGDPGEVAAIGYGTPDARPLLWLVTGPRATTGAHVALAAAQHSAVDAAHAAALASGVRVLQPPRAWEEQQLNYYGVQFADPAGNRLEVLYRQRAESGPTS